MISPADATMITVEVDWMEPFRPSGAVVVGTNWSQQRELYGLVNEC